MKEDVIKLSEFKDHPVGSLNGVYCARCGESFALYPWSQMIHGVDDEGRAFYTNCFKCKTDKEKDRRMVNG